MVARKKGLSPDEKRAKMLELFYESKEFFQMKELEKIAPRLKGVISQSVKEVTQLLVDEGLVECEKIGTFVCYWAFPSKAGQIRKRKLDDLVSKISDLTTKLDESKELLTQAAAGKEESQERTELLAKVQEIKEEEEKLLAEVKKLEKYDPEILKQIAKGTQKMREDANRWTDNISTIKKYCKKKFAIDEKVLEKSFEIPEELEYI